MTIKQSRRFMVNSYFYQLVPSQLVLFNWSTRTVVNSYLKSTRTFFWSTRTNVIIIYYYIYFMIIYLTNMISYDFTFFLKTKNEVIASTTCTRMTYSLNS